MRCVMDPPWCIRIQDEAPLALTAVTRGQVWIWPDDGPPVRLGTGDVVVNRGPAPYTIGDDPAATKPRAVIYPGQNCVTLDGKPLHREMALGVRSWGNSLHGETVMFTGAYRMRGEVSRRLLRVLPAMLTLTADEWDSPLNPLLAEEITKDEPGQEAVLDRLLDLLLIAVLRT